MGEKMSRLKILFISHTFMGGTFVVGSHHLSRELSLKGHYVVHMSTPITLLHLLNAKDEEQRQRIKVAFNKTSISETNVINYIPISFIPWKISRILYNITGVNFLTKTILDTKKILKQDFDYVIIDQPKCVGLEEKLRAKKIIYRATDLYASLINDNVIVKAESKIISVSEGMIGTSTPVVKHLKAISDKPVLQLENGVEAEHFQKKCSVPKEYASIEGPIAVYVGALDHRFDFDALKWISDGFPNLNIMIIGPSDINIKKSFSQSNNVNFLGPKKYSDLPPYLQFATIGLLLLSNHPSNNGRSPMKLYEYASSGLPVVAKATEQIEKVKSSFIYKYKSMDELSSCVEEVLGTEINKKDIIDSAKEHSWAHKTNRLLEFLTNL
ncbi:glycosyltransferase [Shouchella clausii]|uniref:glycosyltransferase family protein n=1 Tax=Shouchella clausii TaxID=79880 RepID=UPI0039835883